MPNSNSRSVCAVAERLKELRQTLGWTQEVAAKKSGYTSRLIRKIESEGNIKPATLVDVLQCYHEAAGIQQWQMADFVQVPKLPTAPYADLGNAVPVEHQFEIMQTYFDQVFNKRNFDWIDRCIAPDVIFHHGESPARQGIGVIRELANALLDGFDPIEMDIEKIFFRDGVVFTFWKVSMRHAGPFAGVEMTKKWVKVRGVSTARFDGDKIVESSDQWDVYNVIRQLKDEPPKWF